MNRSRVTFVVAVAVLLGAIVGLRELTMAVPAEPDRSAALALVVDPATRYEPPGSGRDRAVALSMLCALRVEAEVRLESVRDLPGHRLLVPVFPAPRGSDRDELRGCIEDLAVRRMLVDVESMHVVPLAEARR